MMSDLEKFLHYDKILLPHLIKIAVAHYQFETIHPFLDGNGRKGIDITSQKAIDSFQRIIRIKEYSQNILTAMVKRQKKALRLLEYLFSRPVGDIKSVAEFLEADFSTAKRLADELVKNNLLTEVTGYKRNRLFIFEEYLRLFK